MDNIELLRDAMEKMNWDLAKQLLQERVTRKNRIEDYDILLHFAAFLGDAEMTSILLKKSADTNFSVDDGMSALHFAVSSISTEFINKLPDKNKNDLFSFKDYSSYTDNNSQYRNYQFSSRYYKTVSEERHILAECNYITYSYFHEQKTHFSKNSSKIIINNVDNKGHFILQKKSREINTEVIEMLLNSGADINACLKSGKTPLHLAVECGQVENVKALLKHKPDLNYPCNINNDEGYTPLHLAALGNSEEIVEILINSGANINAQNKAGVTPLHLSVESGLVNNVKTLLKYDADVNCSCIWEKEKYYNPLHFAAKGTNEEIIEMFLNSGSEINVKTENGKTPLHLAVKYGRLKNVEILLKYNPNINCVCTVGNEDDYTPLHFAAMEPNEGIVQMLLKSGSLIDANTKYNKTPLTLAVEKGELRNVKLLLNYNAKVNCLCTSANEDGYSLLHFASKGRNEELLEVLLNSGIDVNTNAVNGKTPLYLAVEFDRVSNVKTLLWYQANVHISCNSGVDAGYSPLHVAAKKSSEEIIEMLLNNGAYINGVTKNDKTSLHLAVEYSRIKSVKTLLTYKANVNYPSVSGDEEDYTEFVFDSKDGSKEIIKKLLQNQNDFHYLHFFPPNGSVGDNFKVLVKYKPVTNCNCYAENTSISTPIHFVVKGFTGEIIPVILKCVNMKVSVERELFLNYHSLEEGLIGNIVKYIPLGNCSCSPKYSEDYTPLHFAAKGSNEKITEILLSNGANINACTANGESALYLAVKQGHIGNVNVLLKYKPDINLSCTLGYNNGYTPLHCASARSDPEILEMLLDNGANINASNSTGETPLFAAVKLGDIDIIKVLLKHKPDVNCNKLAFLLAITHAKKNISQILIDYGFTVNQENVNNVEVFYHSILKKHFSIFDDILRLGFNVNRVFNTGEPILHFICKRNNLRMLKKFLTHNVDLNSVNSGGYTALHILTENQNITLMETLLQHGVDVNIKNNRNGCTALNIACKNYNYRNLQTEKCIKVLLQYNADVNSSDNCGDNPLCYISSKERSYDILEMLLELGADINSRSNYYSCTPLMLVCTKCDNEDDQPEKYLNLLLKYGADVKIVSSDFGSALNIACSNYLEPKIRKHKIDKRIVTLLDQGADLNIEDYNGRTPVMLFLRCYYDFRYNNRNIPEIFKNTLLFIIQHLVMRDFSSLGLFIINDITIRNDLFSDEVEPLCEELTCHISKCEEEILRLKSEKVDEVSLYDITTGNIQMLARYAANYDIIEIFEFDITEVFPIYSHFLLSCIRKGQERLDLLQLITSCLNSLHGNKLPYLVTKKIIGYLDEKDLKMFSLSMTK